MKTTYSISVELACITCKQRGHFPYIDHGKGNMSVAWKVKNMFIQKDPTRCNSVSKFIIPYLYEAHHVSGDTPPIIRGLKLQQQPLVLHMWKVVGRVVAGCNLPRMQNQRLLLQF